MFIGCGSQPRNTIASLLRARALDLASMPCSELSTSSKPSEPELVVVDHLLDQAVAVVAGLDAVDLAVELVLELGDVGDSP